MSQSPTVPQFIGSTISGTNPTLTFSDGNAAHTAYVGVGSTGGSPITGLPEGYVYVQAASGKGFNVYVDTTLKASIGGQFGNFFGDSVAPDVSGTFSLGLSTRYWRDLYLDRDFYWTNIPTANPGAGKIWSDGGTLKVGT